MVALFSPRLSLPLLAVYLLSYRPVHPLCSQLLLPRCGGQNSLCTSANEDLGTLADYDPLTGYEPNDYHISETTEPYIQESSGENGSLNDLVYDDVTIGMALSSPLFTQEREDDASRRQAYHSLDEGLSSSQSSSVGHVRTGRLVADQFDSLIPNVRENPCQDVNLGEPTSFLDHVYLGCTQRECQISKDIVDNYRSMFESRLSSGCCKKNTRNTSHGET